MAIKKANHTKLVNLAIGETSSAAKEKIDQLTKKQKAITAMYTKTKVKGKQIHLILNSGSTGSIIIYQLMQQLRKNVDRPVQTVIVIANGMKKTPVGEINNFPFTVNEITISVKVLVMDVLQYQAFIRNDWLLKTNANLDWETQELKISYQGQYIKVPAICGTFNKKSEKPPVFEFEEKKKLLITKIFMAFGLPSNWVEKTRRWNVVRYSTPEL
ncbi:hypothetical protein G9A89_018810 [Geosiphon pyriformis]|nr:hypothetical protein G9A89_018810 [Geosiphon pyriformis]